MNAMNENDWAELIEAAKDVRKNAYAPYSHFHVGAALKAASGKIYTGCNVENSSYGMTMCAERSAIFKAVSEGERKFEALVIAADESSDGELCPPCGACRQVLAEFCGPDLPITLVAGDKRETHKLGALLPLTFGKAFLDK